MAKKTKKKKVQMVEIARSFSFKKNLGNYEMADFFCSAKKEVKESEADAISEALYEFAKSQVIRDMNKFMGLIPEPKAKISPTPMQGKSTAEKSDKFQEVREARMRSAADDEHDNPSQAEYAGQW